MIKKNSETDGFSYKTVHLLKINEQQTKKIKELEGEIFKWKSIGNTLPNSIYIKDLQGKYVWINNVSLKRLRELHGIHIDIIGKKDSDVFPKKAAKSYMENDQRILQTRKGNVHEERTLLPNKKEVVTLSFKEPLYNEAGNISGILGYTVDITELKEAQSGLQLALEKSEASNQAKTEFLENMRHDLRTPLTGIVGCAHLIKLQADNPKKILEFADDLAESSDALLDFINKILESITIASGEIPLLKKRFNLKEALKQILRLNQSQATVKDLELNLNYDESLPTLIGDPVRIQRIILELVTNALKYTDKGEVKVSARLMKSKKREAIVELRVSDTGMGIPHDKHNEVYTRFTRLIPSYKGTFPGIGLGLSVVKQFIEDLDGEIRIESDVGKGSTFICLIPFQKALLTSGNNNKEESKLETSKKLKESEVLSKKILSKPKFSGMVASQGSKSRALVVEDNEIAAIVVGNIFFEYGCQIDIATNGKIALEKVDKNDYDLILMDVGLADSDGCEVTAQIRLHKKTVPIIGITAHIDEKKKQSCLESGMNAIFTKPMTLEKASEILNTFVLPQSLQKIPYKPNVSIQFIPVLDIDRAIALLGNKKILKKSLELLVRDLNIDLKTIKQYHKKNDWQAIKEIIHKWKGSAIYCGASRLEQVCQLLGTTQKESSSELLYKQLLQVVKATKEAAMNAIASDQQ